MALPDSARAANALEDGEHLAVQTRIGANEVTLVDVDGTTLEVRDLAPRLHAFDNPRLQTAVAAQLQSTRNCQFEQSPLGRIINSRTRQPFSYSDPCVEGGPTVGHHAEAHAEAVKAVKEFWTATFKLR